MLDKWMKQKKPAYSKPISEHKRLFELAQKLKELGFFCADMETTLPGSCKEARRVSRPNLFLEVNVCSC